MSENNQVNSKFPPLAPSSACVAPGNCRTSSSIVLNSGWQMKGNALLPLIGLEAEQDNKSRFFLLNHFLLTFLPSLVPQEGDSNCRTPVSKHIDVSVCLNEWKNIHKHKILRIKSS